jgi:hypothetical protein
MARRNPFTGDEQPLPAAGIGHVVKPAGKSTIQLPGQQLSIHCYESDWDMAGMAERDMREADSKHRGGRTRTDGSRPRGSAGRPGTARRDPR